jgi:hypothetical protein
MSNEYFRSRIGIANAELRSQLPGKHLYDVGIGALVHDFTGA